MVPMSMGALFTFREMLSGFEFLGGFIAVVGLIYIVYGVGLWITESWGARVLTECILIERFSCQGVFRSEC